ncbi:hypothetical protein CDAR_379011 [Caerostris darwini]|uniref:Uncharacterized protein n=1 Tax=Caerostris darwini TaxID=1538125 RepID=A0AAV4TZC2_9ARAC|nr:hypothetical protein CDAR_379011 [Caerostris darwini]
MNCREKWIRRKIVKGDGRSFESIIGGQSNALRATRNARDPRRRLSYAVRPPRATRRQDPHGVAINLQSHPHPLAWGHSLRLALPLDTQKCPSLVFARDPAVNPAVITKRAPKQHSKRQMLLLRCDFFSRSLYDGY